MGLKDRVIANFYKEKADMWLFFRNFARENCVRGQAAPQQLERVPLRSACTDLISAKFEFKDNKI